MRTLYLLTLLALLLPLHLRGEEKETGAKGTPAPEKTPVSVNWGAKAGFTAALSLVQDFTIGDAAIDQVQNNYKVGYFASLFMRINFGRHFLQPEISYNVNQCDISFNKPAAEDAPPLQPAIPQTAYIETKIHSIDIPIIYGYNFIKEGPYALSVFGGPKIRYIWRHKSDIQFKNFDQEGLNEELRPFNLSFTLGVAVTISRIFFDFRYDIGLLNMAKAINQPATQDASEQSAVHFRQRDNVLSFSFGVFF